MIDWREDLATAYDTYVANIDVLLENVGNAEAMALTLGNAKATAESRAFAACWRAIRADLVSETRELRRHEDVDQLPISLTTRNVRPG